MNCKKCNSPIDEDSVFCAKCGSRVKTSNNMGQNNKITLILVAVIILMAIAYVLKGTGDTPKNQNLALSQNNSAVNPNSEKAQQSAGDAPNAQGSSNNASSSSSKEVNNSSNANTTQSAPANTTQTSAQKQDTAIGKMEIEINGEKRFYIAEEEAELNKSIDENWLMEFKRDKYSDNDSFFITLPAKVSQGDSFTLSSKDNLKKATSSYSAFAFSPISIVYISKSGKKYNIGFGFGTSFDGYESFQDSNFKLSVTKWGGRGGNIAGTIEGTLQLTSTDTITFTNGKFECRIAKSGF